MELKIGLCIIGIIIYTVASLVYCLVCLAKNEQHPYLGYMQGLAVVLTQSIVAYYVLTYFGITLECLSK